VERPSENDDSSASSVTEAEQLLTRLGQRCKVFGLILKSDGSVSFLIGILMLPMNAPSIVMT
jgi:hypothetical protein